MRGGAAIDGDERALVALIEFYLESGVDAVLADAPVDRFAVGDAAPAEGFARPPERFAAAPLAGGAAAGTGPARTGLAAGGFARDGRTREGSAQEGRVQDGSARAGGARGGFGQDGLGQDGVAQDGFGQDGFGQGGIAQDGAGQDGFGREGLGREAFGREGFGREGLAPVGPGREGPGVGGTPAAASAARAGGPAAERRQPGDVRAGAAAPRPATDRDARAAAARQPPFDGGPSATIPDAEVVAAARAAAAAATSLEALRDALDRFEGCNLKRTATRLCFADGTPGARVMLIGEAPGREEDEQGRPFVGRAGRLLDRMLAAIGLDRTSVYIANVVPWRPPGNRTPSPQEVEICRPFMQRQIALADPEILVFLGNAAAAAMTGRTTGILKLRGTWGTVHTGPREARWLATLHPAYLLRQPLQKRLVWRDLMALRRALDGRE